MTATMRKIVKIDEAKCNGCGLCVPSCAEGAIRIVAGKARLAGENLCDGLGACLGHCPQDAITVEERPADAFDEQAVACHLEKAAPAAVSPATSASAPAACPGGGCPGSAARMLRPHPAAAAAGPARPSQLGQWPVQLALVPTRGDMWRGAEVLIAADCVAYALADFHERLLAGKTLVVACPKLDDVAPYVDKLAAIFADSDIRSVTVARMEVPCCMGLVTAVRAAMDRAGRGGLPFREVVIGIDGAVQKG